MINFTNMNKILPLLILLLPMYLSSQPSDCNAFVDYTLNDKFHTIGTIKDALTINGENNKQLKFLISGDQTSAMILLSVNADTCINVGSRILFVFDDNTDLTFIKETGQCDNNVTLMFIDIEGLNDPVYLHKFKTVKLRGIKISNGAFSGMLTQATKDKLYKAMNCIMY